MTVPARLDHWLPIVQRVADLTGVSVQAMRGRSRTRRTSMARRMAMRAILAEDPAATHAELGRFFGRERSSVSYLLRTARGGALRRVDEDREVDCD